MNHREKRQFLIQALLKERPEYRDMRIPTEPESQRQLLRGLMNIRAPRRMDAEVLKTQDEYLQAETAAKGITDLDDLTPVQPGLYFWQGDITTLRCDAIVNAANSGMTGCYIPVGPIIEGGVTRRDRELLASCYRSCLELAAESSLESVAFCCISTGEFHFPNEQAAQIAVETVKQFMNRNTGVKKVIFNVFKDLDKAIYKKLL